MVTGVIYATSVGVYAWAATAEAGRGRGRAAGQVERASRDGCRPDFFSIFHTDEGCGDDPAAPANRGSLVNGHHRAKRGPAVEETRHVKREIDAAMTHPVAEVVVPIGAVEGFGVRVDVHHVRDIFDDIG